MDQQCTTWIQQLIAGWLVKETGQIEDEKYLPRETKQTLKNRKEHWNEFHKKHEV